MFSFNTYYSSFEVSLEPSEGKHPEGGPVEHQTNLRIPPPHYITARYYTYADSNRVSSNSGYFLAEARKNLPILLLVVAL